MEASFGAGQVRSAMNDVEFLGPVWEPGSPPFPQAGGPRGNLTRPASFPRGGSSPSLESGRISPPVATRERREPSAAPPPRRLLRSPARAAVPPPLLGSALPLRLLIQTPPPAAPCSPLATPLRFRTPRRLDLRRRHHLGRRLHSHHGASTSSSSSSYIHYLLISSLDIVGPTDWSLSYAIHTWNLLAIVIVISLMAYGITTARGFLRDSTT
ncbi:lysine-rich arabinogalactan protein 19-like isoform X1 [Panicum hallii]|uniref:lysine-rich arabinogalactan protein 19-like isoform X1 n=1 Tax=Panicum hallii TaxID=206008 RepID=UPI000DF4D0E9|nr:lysine-rich arabinogalactan protein 19-like isoform X1 [Panicum hallii]